MLVLNISFIEFVMPVSPYITYISFIEFVMPVSPYITFTKYATISKLFSKYYATVYIIPKLLSLNCFQKIYYEICTYVCTAQFEQILQY